MGTLYTVRGGTYKWSALDEAGSACPHLHDFCFTMQCIAVAIHS